jgi:hypothetical protein
VKVVYVAWVGTAGVLLVAGATLGRLLKRGYLGS